MDFDARFADYVHPQHQRAFSDAAREFGHHILVRRTGAASLRWVGMEGYGGKRADMKAKTAKKDVGPWLLAGLVCSPLVHPGAFDDLKKALACWEESRHLVSIPPDNAGFDDRGSVRAPTPYVLQNNPRRRHHGCIAWVEGGLVAPRYVHGDYDLYAIVPAGQPYCPAVAGITAKGREMTSMQQTHGRTLAERVAPGVVDMTGPLSFKVASFINNRIAAMTGSAADALMVNHGEQLNIGAKGYTHEPVLAFLAAPRNGRWAQLLDGAAEHSAFFRTA